MTREEVIDTFSRLAMWARRGVRAPHKPLLIGLIFLVIYEEIFYDFSPNVILRRRCSSRLAILACRYSMGRSPFVRLQCPHSSW